MPRKSAFSEGYYHTCIECDRLCIARVNEWKAHPLQCNAWSTAPKSKAAKDTIQKEMMTAVRHCIVNKDQKGSYSEFVPVTVVRQLMEDVGIATPGKPRTSSELHRQKAEDSVGCSQVSFSV